MCQSVGLVNGVITSTALGVPHGFPTREGQPPKPLITVRQTHSARVVEAKYAEHDGDLGEGDALWTDRDGVTLGIKTADCVPLLLEDPVGRRVAAVHAGWRGAIAEIPLRALEVLKAHGTKPGDVRAVLGPSIRTCCYVVQDDLAGQFTARFGAEVVVRRDGKPYLDVARAVRKALEEGGVPTAQITDTGECTSCDKRFHSHRRDHAGGRQVSFIVCHWPRGAGATSL
jgi:YfiH family protein